MNTLLILAAITCSDWELKPNGHWMTLRPTSVPNYMDHSTIGDLAPNVITTENGSSFNLGPHSVTLFDFVTGACGGK